MLLSRLVVRDRESAAVLGAEYLRRRRHEASRKELCRLLTPIGRDAKPRTMLAEQQITDAFASLHRQDFRDGRVLKINGWTLSLSELRVCALVYLDNECTE